MDCKTPCANYKPIVAERPTDHPNRIFAEDLRIGMVIRRHGAKHERKLVVILGKSEDGFAPSLQLLAGHQPVQGLMSLLLAGLRPHSTGSWVRDTWCEEVT